jgi:hypothetical protein
MRFSLVAEFGFVLPRFSDDDRFKVAAAALKNCARFNKDVETFLGNEASDTERSQF